MARVRAAVDAGRISSPVVVVLEGKARAGAPSGLVDGVTVVHADAGGDETLIDVAIDAASAPGETAVTLVTADRELRRRAQEVGANVVGPGWLLSLLDPPPESETRP